MTRKLLAVGSIAIVTAALALVGLAPSTEAASTVLARYPYLTDLTSTSVTVTWATTSADTSPGVAAFGTGSNCTQTVVPAQHAASTYTAFGESAPYYQHSVQLTGLTSSTSYCYRIYSGTSTPGPDLLGTPAQFPTTFTTAASATSTSSFSFDVLGDFGETSLSNTAPLGTYNPYQAALDGQLAASATAATDPAQFAVSTGDIAYNDGSTTNYGDLNHPADRTSGAAEQSNVFDARYWAQVGSRLPLYSVAGNHGRNGNFFSIWPSAANVAASHGTYTTGQSYPAVDGIAAGKYPSDWYAFTVGGVRFYVLDSDWTDVSQSTGLGTGCGAKTCPSYQVDRDEHWQQSSAEYTWLASDLQQDIATRGPSALRMAFFHYPLRVDQNNYTTQQDVYLQNSPANPNGGSSSLEAMLAHNNVNLVFNGHAHLYERNVAPLDGVPNYVSGGGGGVPTNVAPTCSPTDAYARGWDPTKAVGSSCGRPSDGAAAKPTATAQAYHFLKVTVSGTDVRVDPTDSTGAVFDPMTYHFAPDPVAPTTPGTPSVVRGTGTNVTVTLGAASSDNVGVISYDIYRDGSYVATVPVSVKTWTDASVAPGTHTWTVAARDQRGNQSAPSAASTAITIADTTPPTAPTLSASSGQPNEIDLSWTGATDNVGITGYNVYRDGAMTAAVTDVHETTWADTGLATGSTHTYTVVAHDAAGNNSPPSNTAGATVAGPVPVFTEDFESGSIGPPRWTTPTAGLVAQQATVHGGGWAAEESSTGTPTWASTQLPSTYRALHVSAWVYIKQRSTSAGLFKLRSANGAYIAYLYVNAAAYLAVRNDAGLVTHASTTTVSTGQWHKVEIGLDTNPGGPVTIWAALDGSRATFSTPVTTSETLGTNPIGQLTLGDDVAGRNYDIAIDDITADTNV